MLLKPLMDPKTAPVRLQSVFPEAHLLTREEQILAGFKSKLDKITNEIRARLSVKFINKQRDIRVMFHPTDTLRVRCDDTVSISALGSYLTNSFYDLLIKSESNNYEEAYFLIKKVQAVVAFCKANSERPSFDSEAIYSKVNELVFLQNNDFIDIFTSRFHEFLRYLKTSGPKMKRLTPAALANKEETEQALQGKLVALRVKSKALFAMALMFSDQKQHNQAIANALKALRCGYSTIQLTLSVVLYKLTKKINKLKNITDELQKTKKLKKKAYLQNLARVLSSILARVDATPNLFKKSAKIGSTLSFFRTLYLETEDANLSITPEDVDLAFLNNPDIINCSLLKDSTILHLTNMNYTSFGHELECDLQDEISERSVFEKVASLAVSFYILSVEHRFNEHNTLSGTKFYKSLLDYFNPEFAVKGSELFLSKAVELAYLYLPDSFPFVSQILLVFKNFELNRSKQIPENGEEQEFAYYLHPFKNGFRSSLIIPIIRTPPVSVALEKFESFKDREKPGAEVEFCSEKPVCRNFDKDPQSLIRKIYVPKQKAVGPKTEKPKMATAVMRSPDLIAQKQLNAIKLKVFRGHLTSSQTCAAPEKENHMETISGSALFSSYPNTACVSPIPSAKISSQKIKRIPENSAKVRVGSSKLVSNKENETGAKSEKRANSSEITRLHSKELKTDKKSAQIKIPAKAAPKSDFSLLKSTEYLFSDNYKKVALKLRGGNNENLDLNKKGAVLGQLKSNVGEKRGGKNENVPSIDSLPRENNSNFFLQHNPQRNSPTKTQNGFKISSGAKPPQTVYFQNFIKNKNNIAEILSKFK